MSFVVHRTDKLFPSKSTNTTRLVGGDIISATVTGTEDLTNLSDPVVLEFTVSTLTLLLKLFSLFLYLQKYDLLLTLNLEKYTKTLKQGFI